MKLNWRSIAAAAYMVNGLSLVWAASLMTNADVEKLLSAGMSDDVIVNAVKSAEPAFDTSADALIALKNRGASQAVIAALAARASGNVPPALSAPVVPALPPEMFSQHFDVWLIDGGKRTKMYSAQPDTRMGSMWGSVLVPGVPSLTYWSLRGRSAKLRLTSTVPTFEAMVPKNVRPEDAVSITAWATRSNGNREIKIAIYKPLSGGATLSTRQDFPAERVIKAEYVLTEKQGEYDLVAVRPLVPLKVGEYAFVVGQPVFDFGVDHGGK